MYKNLRNLQEKLLELISELRKAEGQKADIQKPIVFLYSSNEKLEVENFLKVPFLIGWKIWNT